jgi:hypothetical protein
MTPRSGASTAPDLTKEGFSTSTAARFWPSTIDAHVKTLYTYWQWGTYYSTYTVNNIHLRFCKSNVSHKSASNNLWRPAIFHSWHMLTGGFEKWICLEFGFHIERKTGNWIEWKTELNVKLESRYLSGWNVRSIIRMYNKWYVVVPSEFLWAVKFTPVYLSDN